MKNSRIRLFACTLLILALVSVLFAACARSGSRSSNEEGRSASGASGGGQSGGATSSGTVHLGDTNFRQNSVTISKGGSVKLVDDASVVHIIQNGSWDNGTGK